MVFSSRRCLCTLHLQPLFMGFLYALFTISLFGNRAVSTNLYFREKNFRILMMRKFRLAEPVHLMCWVENFSRSQSATGIEGEGAGALMKVHVLPSQSEIVAIGPCLGLQAFLS